MISEFQGLNWNILWCLSFWFSYSKMIAFYIFFLQHLMAFKFNNQIHYIKICVCVNTCGCLWTWQTSDFFSPLMVFSICLSYFPSLLSLSAPVQISAERQRDVPGERLHMMGIFTLYYELECHHLRVAYVYWCVPGCIKKINWKVWCREQKSNYGGQELYENELSPYREWRVILIMMTELTSLKISASVGGNLNASI